MDQTSHIRRQVRLHVGKQVTIMANLGRKRRQRFSGTLLGAYNNVFTLSCMLNGINQNLTYSYNDIITGNVVFLRDKSKTAKDAS